MTEEANPLFVGYAIETPNGTMDTIFPTMAGVEAYVTRTLGISMEHFRLTGWKATPLYRVPQKPCACGTPPKSTPASPSITGMIWATPSEAH